MFFDECSSLEEVKTLYKKLSFLFHPDRGGDNELMQKLNIEYDSYYNKKNTNFNYDKDKIEKTLVKLEEILKNYKKHKEFDPSFVKSVKKFHKVHGFITEGQSNSIMKIYKLFLTKGWIK